jgi:hypothetical protein
MGNSGGGGCLYTNQGGTIDERKNEINIALQRARDTKNGTINDMDNYFNDVLILYGLYNNRKDNERDYFNKNPNNSNNVSLVNSYSSNFIENQPYRFKSFSIIGIRDGTTRVYDDSKPQNMQDNYEYFFYNGDNNSKCIIQKYFETGKYYETAINSQQKLIQELTEHIKNNYKDINTSIILNDTKIDQINETKGSIAKQTYSVSFFENLLIQSYKQLYNAIYVENKVLLNNNSMKQNIYSTDNSKYTYETDKINFYENFNTFLFFFYYILIFASIIVISIYNIKLLTTLSLFHVLLLILILYPIFILKYQNFLYKYFEKFLMYFKDAK